MCTLLIEHYVQRQFVSLSLRAIHYSVAAYHQARTGSPHATQAMQTNVRTMQNPPTQWLDKTQEVEKTE